MQEKTVPSFELAFPRFSLSWICEHQINKWKEYLYPLVGYITRLCVEDHVSLELPWFELSIGLVLTDLWEIKPICILLSNDPQIRRNKGQNGGCDTFFVSHGGLYVSTLSGKPN